MSEIIQCFLIGVDFDPTTTGKDRWQFRTDKGFFKCWSASVSGKASDEFTGRACELFMKENNGYVNVVDIGPLNSAYSQVPRGAEQTRVSNWPANAPPVSGHVPRPNGALMGGGPNSSIGVRVGCAMNNASLHVKMLMEAGLFKPATEEELVAKTGAVMRNLLVVSATVEREEMQKP